MGFTALAATAAALKETGTTISAILIQSKDAENQAKAIEDTAVANQSRAARNAAANMSTARADAGASNLASEGSVTVRERDLATRLQDEITANANTALAEANSVRQQGAYNAWQTRQQARRSYANIVGSGLSAIGSIFQTATAGDNSSSGGNGSSS